jgi:hypothetical protein
MGVLLPPSVHVPVCPGFLRKGFPNSHFPASKGFALQDLRRFLRIPAVALGF